MAIVNERSDLKQLKYVEFATYGEPPVTKDINNPPKYNRLSKQATARVDDTVRMTKLLTANNRKLSPAASNFLANQATIATISSINALQKNNRTNGTRELGTQVVETQIGQTAKNAGKVIGGLLAQTPVAGTGTHFIYAPAVGTQYLKNVDNFQGSPEERGRIGTFLQNVARATGILDGDGVNGARRALAGQPIISDIVTIGGKVTSYPATSYPAGEKLDSTPGSIRSREINGNDGKRIDSSLSTPHRNVSYKEGTHKILDSLPQPTDSNPNAGTDYTRGKEDDNEEGSIRKSFDGNKIDSALSREAKDSSFYDGSYRILDSLPQPTDQDPNAGTDYTRGTEEDGKEGSIRSSEEDGKIKSNLSIENRDSSYKTGETLGISSITPTQGSLPNLNIEFNDNSGANRFDEEENSLKNTFESSKLRQGLSKIEDNNNKRAITRLGTFGQIFNGEYVNFYGEEGLQPVRVENSTDDGTVAFFDGLADEDKVNTDPNLLNKNRSSKLNTNATDLEKSKTDTNGKFNRDFGTVSDSKKATTIYVKATKKGLGNPFGTGLGYSSDELTLFGVDGNEITTRPISEEISEIIPFEFQVFDPNFRDKPRYLYFRAYLDSFSDNYTGNWNGTKYMGRAEEVYNYTGFDREVSFDFKIAALSRQELNPLYTKLNYFTGLTAPSYDNGAFMRGVYTKVSIGDYLKAVPGFFSSINLSWDTAYPWEIGFEENGDENNLPRNPTILNVSTTFKPVHNFNPALGEKFIGTSRLANA